MEGDQRLGKSPEPRNISIHSLRMEGDNRRQQPQAKASHFNPLPPHGGRPAGSGGITMTITFQSTPSAWRETGQDHGTRLCRSISIHSLRMEGDYIDLGYLCGGVYFNPLPPHGGRHIDLVDGDPAIIISIHSLRMEGDLPCQNLLSAWGHFNPLPPHGGRPCTPSWT